MKKFGARRVPRKIGGEEEEPRAEEHASESEPVLKRPTAKPRKTTTPRTSFGPSATQDDDDGGNTNIVIPKRSNLSKVATQRNASKRSSLLASQLPRRQDDDEDENTKPSYSAASLRELKASTPSTPASFGSGDEQAVADVQNRTKELDLSSKFGSSLGRYGSSAIPSASEIAEKKARRARLAREHAADEYISLDPDDPGLDNMEDEDGVDGDPNVTRDEQGRLILKPKDKYNIGESRLVNDDEDIMENFEDFTEDGKVHLGRKAEREAEKRKKEEIRAQIAAAEGDAEGSDAESNTSEQERNAAFEAAQTRHGTYAATHNATPSDPYADPRPTTPPKISPLPTLDGVIERLRKQVTDMRVSRAQKMAEMDTLQREKIRLAEEEVRIQGALRETADKFQQLRAEKGINQQNAPSVEAPTELKQITASGSDVPAVKDMLYASVQSPDQQVKEADDVDVGEDAELDGADAADAAPAGLGFVSTREADGWVGAGGGLGMSTSGMGRPPAGEDDW
ncbi:hypothetical protein KC332_g8398 [Hortaea werneckii]|uniref:Uncharacterized protein n=2 Tax=Hortaea werneckii TaxID=91943 RepID=A0A3M7JB33_HORWE|nr:hypothetical protein KC342_g14857 [Hortaea werneckii]OTA39264.1 hypothetical protein BTJ68_00769 [Hortaea werneckii EXF-2000]KAI6827895.1 hypothetical protein KC358_g7359 [Hortaea werneckii]KAI6832778.1 hypothetical protein KC350_g7061 [Hortaea werneckii]KAI6917054.1 hypothetical protein KC348_g11296 [Hortaea werneckii]